MAVTQVQEQQGAAEIDFKAIRGVLFDIDGTLCNSDPLHFNA